MPIGLLVIAAMLGVVGASLAPVVVAGLVGGVF
jgi:hypothetical protein